MSEQFLAQAQVLVTPNTKAFRAQLREDLESITKNVKAKVLIRPDMKGFQAELRELVISSTRNVRARVLVRPDMTGFRTALRKEVAEVSTGLSIPIGGVAAAAGGGAAPGARQQTAREQSLAEFEKLEAEKTALFKRAEAQRTAFFKEAEAARAAAAKLATDQASRQSKAFFDEQKRLGIDPATGISREELAIERELAAVRRTEIATQRAVSRATTESEVASIKLSAAKQREVIAEELASRARTLGTTSLIRQTEAYLAATTAAVNKALADQAAAGTSDLTSKRLGSAGRAIGATGAAAVGLRGAVLAANAAFIAGTVAAMAFGKAVKSAVDLESELNVFQITAGATASQMAKVDAETIKLGKDLTLPGVSAGDAAQAMTELAKAGLDVEDSMDAARGVLQLATAAQIGNAEATQLTASALNAFGLAGADAIKVADLLTTAANASQGSILDMGIALQQSAAVARQAGVSVEDTVSLLTLLARAGIKGSDAGTSLRVAFTRLINPTDKARSIIERLDLKLRDVQGNIRPEVFAELSEKTAGWSRANREAAAAVIFGTDALRAYSIFARAGAQGLEILGTEQERMGATAKVAGARTQGLAGSAKALESNLETLGVTIGRGLTPALQGLADWTNSVVSGFNLGAEAAGRFFKAIKGFGDFDAVNADLGDLTDKLEETQSEMDHFKESGGIVPRGVAAGAEELTSRLREIGQVLKTTEAGQQKWVRAFVASSPRVAKAMEDGVITPLEKAELQSTALGRVFLSGLPKAVFKGFGSELRSAIENAVAQAKVAVEDLGPEIRSGIEDASREAVRAANQMGADLGSALRTSLSAAFFGAVSTARTSLGRLETELLQLEVSGAPSNALTRNLNDQIAEQDRIISEAQERLAKIGTSMDPKSKTARQKATTILNEALSDKKTLMDRVVAIAEEVKNDAERKRTQAEKAISDADQAVIDAFERKRDDFDARAFQASQDDSLRNDLKIAKQFKKFLFSQIAILRDRIKDKETERDILRIVRDALRRIDAEISGYRKQIREGAQATLRERLGLQLEQAQLRLELGIGTRAAVLAVYDRMIAAKQAELRKVKGQRDLELKIGNELLQLQVDRKNFLEEAVEESKKGTTAFDLLRQSAETFVKSGGNLITGRQPFAGPAGFTANIGQWLQATNRVAGGGIDLSAPRAGGPPTQRERVERELVEAIRENTRALTGRGGNRTTQPVLAIAPQPSTTFVGPLQPLSVRAARYWEARQTREALEANNG